MEDYATYVFYGFESNNLWKNTCLLVHSYVLRCFIFSETEKQEYISSL